ncbi:MAG: UDP-N-acetylglucosamine 4,6-dehydratase (inverting) [Pseudomonadales bacterium]
MSLLDGKVVLITGATGSFGKRFISTVLESQNPQSLIVFSRDELKQFEMQQTVNANNVKYVLGDVRDYNRVRRIMDGVDIVIHAAAMKQVPASEHNPMEAIKTNIFGAENIINAAIETGVDKVIALSTDKAANPMNLYGATKLASDKLFVAANALSAPDKTRFSVVRYGNVIGSRGSVVPFFLSLRDTGILPITEPRMTRFWITLGEGVQMVLDCLATMLGGEIFIPKIPSMTVVDVAKTIGPECELNIIGIRPGEKLHEVMITSDDSINTVELDNKYVIQPAADWWDQESYLSQVGGKRVPEGFSYTSDNNSVWMNSEEFAKILAKEKIEI